MTQQARRSNQVKLLVAAMALALPAACGVNDNPVLEGPPPTSTAATPSPSP